MAIVEDRRVEALYDFEAVDQWHYLSVTFIRYIRSIKTECVFWIDDNAPVHKFIEGKLVDTDTNVLTCPPYAPDCYRADTIGFNFRGALKYVRLNSRFNCLDHYQFAQGVKKFCPPDDTRICVDIDTVNHDKETFFITCPMDTWYNETDGTCIDCDTRCEYC